ncbi:MAG: alpha-N-arabinofuranosidase [Verrucomicrobiota bacterium]|nr:alpha-N-arabinofuranosidase [Verrucomicrobiota bacterium]
MKIIKMTAALLGATLLGGPLRADVSVNIDLQKTGAPISPYIYGQFIEHLGRCFYGGLWAEMLQDRKFYYPVTDDYHPWGTSTDPNWKAGPYHYLKASPWKVIGPPGTVSMDTHAPYVGEHTPVVHLPGDGSWAGISQDGLWVLAGSNYVGHIVLAGAAGAAPIKVRLALDDGTTLTQTIQTVSADFESYPFQFTAPAASENARLEIVSQGRGAFKIGTLSLMPADNLNGWRRDVVALLRQLDAPVYRWPGGNFVSGYNWRDGIGPRDKRPPRKNPAWKGVEPNDVGSDETMQLMQLIHAQAYVALNTGLGGVEEAANEVEYFNGPTNTPMGRWRAENGHPEPYGVKLWAVGNEMFGNWQLGHMPLADYVRKHNQVADAIWKVDPGAQLVAVGEVGRWDQTMLTVCQDHMNYLSEHIYCRDLPDVAAHARQLADQIRRVAGAFREDRHDIPGLAARHIRVAMDEWNYWYGDYLYGELGVRYHLKDALGVAEGLNEYFRNSDIYFMANYAQTINVIGCIKTTPTAADFATTGLVLELYRHHYGEIPVQVAGETGDLDVAAAWTADRKALTLSIVNPDPDTARVTADFGGTAFAPEAMHWVISNPDPEAYNEPGKPPQVVIKKEPAAIKNSAFEAPGYSVNLYRQDVR